MTFTVSGHHRQARDGMRAGFLTGILLFGCLVVGAVEASERPTVDEVRSRWDRYMLDGLGVGVQFVPWSGTWVETTDKATMNRLPDDTGSGQVLGDVFATRAGIVVILPARQPLLLWRRDGWSVVGGRLGRVSTGSGKILDLYGRSVKHEDGFYPPTRMLMHAEPPTAITVFEFFLLTRLRRWTVPPPGGPASTGSAYRVRGHLSFLENQRKVEVRLQVLETTIVEQVPVDGASGSGVSPRAPK